MRAHLIAILVFAGCAAPAGVPATHEPLDARLTPEDESASEVSLAADPTDPRHLVAAANSGGGFGIYVSRDAGLTWSATRYAAERVDPQAAGVARFRTLSDPAVAFAPDGTVWIAGLAYLPTSAVFVTRSMDGGETWENGAIVEESDIATSFNDKEWLAVGPDGAIVVAWQKELAMDQLRALDEAAGIDADQGDIVVSRSADHGASWTDPAIVSRASRFNNGTQVAFTPDGRAHLLWVDYAASSLAYASSEDSGATWSEPRAIVEIEIVPPFDRYARMHTLPGFAASPTGALYATWHDARADEADVMAIASADGGATWGSPVRVPAEEGIQMYPAVAAGPDGRIHVTFYDSSPDPAYPRFRYAIASAEGPDLRFGPVTNASTASFTIFDKAGVGPADPDDEARGIGDYTSAAATSAGIFAAWADGRDDAPAIYAMRKAP